MEDESGLDSSSQSNSLTFAQYVDEMCPYYMAMGVPYNEFWYGDYTQLEHYRKAYEIQRERANHDAWLQGAYIYDALCAVSPVLHAFAKKGTKPIEYLKEPYGTSKKDAEAKQEIDAKVGAAKFFAFATELNKKFKT